MIAIVKNNVERIASQARRQVVSPSGLIDSHVLRPCGMSVWLQAAPVLHGSPTIRLRDMRMVIHSAVEALAGEGRLRTR